MKEIKRRIREWEKTRELHFGFYRSAVFSKNKDAVTYFLSNLQIAADRVNVYKSILYSTRREFVYYGVSLFAALSIFCSAVALNL